VKLNIGPNPVQPTKRQKISRWSRVLSSIKSIRNLTELPDDNHGCLMSAGYSCHSYMAFRICKAAAAIVSSLTNGQAIPLIRPHRSGWYCSYVHTAHTSTQVRMVNSFISTVEDEGIFRQTALSRASPESRCIAVTNRLAQPYGSYLLFDAAESVRTP
jgi:hypothetical protein